MKRLHYALFALPLLVALAGCGVGQKPSAGTDGGATKAGATSDTQKGS